MNNMDAKAGATCCWNNEPELRLASERVKETGDYWLKIPAEAWKQ
jgi:hypothetical protein